jgi:uncharacterized membrane protein (UPF0136 family)
MNQIAAGVMRVVGVVSFVGGGLGYWEKGSVASLVAGVVAGLLLFVCAYGVARRPLWSLLGAGVVALALLGFFLPKALRPGETVSSSGYYVQVLMAIGGLLILVTTGLALATQKRSQP